MLTMTNRIFSLHIDAIGLFRLGKTNEQRLGAFENLLDEHFIKSDSTALIPTYSYSYTRNKTYDMRNSPSDVGFVTEYLRQRSSHKRTIDPLFSYVVLGNGISDDNFHVRNYECFGDHSLISELYNKDAMICSIAAPWTRVFTELHFIERRLGMKYRKNKTFFGKTIDQDGHVHETQATFYCKDYDYGLRSGHTRLAEDLIKDGVMVTFNLSPAVEIRGVFFKDLYQYVEDKVKKDYFYLCEEIPNDR
jgi:aminoglycoside 3-N-acetyltransferase